MLLTMPVQRQFDDLFACDRCFDAPLIRLETCVSRWSGAIEQAFFFWSKPRLLIVKVGEGRGGKSRGSDAALCSCHSYSDARQTENANSSDL